MKLSARFGIFSKARRLHIRSLLGVLISDPERSDGREPTAQGASPEHQCLYRRWRGGIVGEDWMDVVRLQQLRQQVRDGHCLGELPATQEE
jgi:hypothetical protein